jgi:hypothetical protein
LGQKPQAELDFQVFPIKYARASEVAQILEELFVGRNQSANSVPPLRVVVDDSTNSILVRATTDQIVEVKRLLVALDDNKSRAAPSGPQVSVFALRNIEPDRTLENALRLIVQPPKGAFALDPQLKVVVVTGDRKTLDDVASLLDRLDRQVRAKENVPSEVQLRVVWLAAGREQKDTPKPPDDLQGVVDELGKIGVKDLRLVSQSVVKATTGVTFTMTGSAQLLHTPCHLSIRGSVLDRGAEPPTVQINIEATTQATGPITGPIRGGGQTLPVCQIGTNIVTPPGHSVVLGVTPTGDLTSVFIVQLIPPKKAVAPASRK